MERDSLSTGLPMNCSNRRKKLPFRDMYIMGFLVLFAFVSVVGLLSARKSETALMLLGKVRSAEPVTFTSAFN